MKIRSSQFAAIGLFLLCVSLFSGCATVGGGRESPKVDVVGITKSESDTSALQFTIQLRIVNPSAETLNLKGLYYELSLEGIDLVNGTARSIPPIEGYSDTVVSVSSAASLIGSARLASMMINDPRENWRYELKAKLGTSSKWMPSTTITESGEIPLGR
jgi:LEA14-like dessication related protein